MSIYSSRALKPLLHFLKCDTSQEKTKREHPAQLKCIGLAIFWKLDSDVDVHLAFSLITLNLVLSLVPIWVKSQVLLTYRGDDEPIMLHNHISPPSPFFVYSANVLVDI